MAEVLAVKNGVALPRDSQVGPAKDTLFPGSASGPALTLLPLPYPLLDDI